MGDAGGEVGILSSRRRLSIKPFSRFASREEEPDFCSHHHGTLATHPQMWHYRKPIEVLRHAGNGTYENTSSALFPVQLCIHAHAANVGTVKIHSVRERKQQFVLLYADEVMISIWSALTVSTYSGWRVEPANPRASSHANLICISGIGTRMGWEE